MTRRIRCALVVAVVLLLTSCGGEGESTPASSAEEAESSTTPAPTEESAPQPTGSLASEPVKCEDLTAPRGFRPAPVAPPACAYESDDAYVSAAVGGAPPSFEILQRMEEDQAKSDGVTAPALEQVEAEGWTYAVSWPEEAGLNRMDWYLLDASGRALTCKVGVQGGQSDPTTYADFCESVRELVYTP